MTVGAEEEEARQSRLQRKGPVETEGAMGRPCGSGNIVLQEEETHCVQGHLLSSNTTAAEAPLGPCRLISVVTRPPANVSALVMEWRAEEEEGRGMERRAGKTFSSRQALSLKLGELLSTNPRCSGNNRAATCERFSMGFSGDLPKDQQLSGQLGFGVFRRSLRVRQRRALELCSTGDVSPQPRGFRDIKQCN
ncbi:unnamed protein product [Gadus morhua 'NCC']